MSRLAGYLVLGIGFGILLLSIGYGADISFLMGLFIYAGSMQYMDISLISAHASIPIIALTTLMVNARHILYGISMADRYKNRGIKKLYMIFSLTDETYSLVCNYIADLNENQLHDYYFFVSLFNHLYWISGCVIGSFVGKLITFDLTGLDFALTALFITVLTDQLLKKENRIPGAVGVAVSVICLLIFGAERFLIPAMIGIVLVLLPISIKERSRTDG